MSMTWAMREAETGRDWLERYFMTLRAAVAAGTGLIARLAYETVSTKNVWRGTPGESGMDSWCW